MASLWNFVARLTSRRRQEPQQSLPTANVDQQGAETLPAAGAAPEDLALMSEPPPAGASVGKPHKAVDAVDITARSDPARATDAAALAGYDHSDTSAVAEPDIQASSPAPHVIARRRHKRKVGQAVAGRPLANAPTVTDQAISLDDEIKLLRGKLIEKLELQNAQLKTMLKRFER